MTKTYGCFVGAFRLEHLFQWHHNGGDWRGHGRPGLSLVIRIHLFGWRSVVGYWFDGHVAIADWFVSPDVASCTGSLSR